MKKAKPEKHSIGDLSFVASRDGKTLPKPTKDQLPRCFWNVAGTGDYHQDCKIGQRLALEYLAFEEADKGGSGNLQLIVRDMPHPLTGVETGFLIMVSIAAGAGAAEARRVAGYWLEMSAQQEMAEACAVKKSQVTGPAKSALDEIDARICPIGPQPALRDEVERLVEAKNIRALIVLYDSYVASAAAFEGVGRRSRELDIVDEEASHAWSKAYYVADRLKTLRPDEHDLELYATTLFNCALAMGNSLAEAAAVVAEINAWPKIPWSGDRFSRR
jgi:hypothetical protein